MKLELNSFHLPNIDYLPIKPSPPPFFSPTQSSRFPFTLPLSQSDTFRLPRIVTPDDDGVDLRIIGDLNSWRVPRGSEDKGVGPVVELDACGPQDNNGALLDARVAERDMDLWEDALKAGGIERDARVLSWDNLKSSARYDSPFLTEASTSVCEAEAARLPNSATLAATRAYSRATLADNVLTVALGMETPLFAWDAQGDRFVWRKDVKGKGKAGDGDGRLWGVSIEASASLINPFLALGTSLVRLEGITKSLTTAPDRRSSSSNSSRPKTKDEPTKTSHAVATSLSTLIFWVRSELANLRPPDPTEPLEPSSFAPEALLALSSQLSPLLATVTSLTTLFHRSPSCSPPYAAIPLSTHSLLSHLHANLSHHLEHSLTPPLMDQAIAAWLFDCAMKGWWRGWEDWVGVGEGGTAWKDVGIEEQRARKKTVGVFGQDEEEECEGRSHYILHTSQLPAFLRRSVAIELFEAGRSLRLLRSSKPDHPLCRRPHIEGTGQGILWGEGAAESYQDAMLTHVMTMRREIAAWRTGFPIPVVGGGSATDTTSPSMAEASAVNVQSTKYNPELAPLFSLFDLLPGLSGQRTTEQSLWRSDKEEAEMLAFLARVLPPTPTFGPDRLTILPPSSPSLEILLSSSLFNPLLTFSRLPSTSLLTLFFTDLSLSCHLTILHSYLLLGDQAFARRLREALFSPPEERDGVTIRRRRRRDQAAYGDDRGELGAERAAWGTGMGIRLVGGSGATGGAELSLMLRTTLDDSIAEGRESVGKKEARTRREVEMKVGEEKAWEELESRLSFAVKDGNPEEEARWSDPQSLAALDFLYLDYKPPSPLDLIITPSILSKYNQIFSHLLRLLRVEAVARSIWLDLSKPNLASTPTGRADSRHPPPSHLLDSDPAAKRELQALAFEVRGLVGAICSFSFDAAVAGNYDLFRRAVAKVERGATMRERRAHRGVGGGGPTTEAELDAAADEAAEAASWNLDALAGLHARFLDAVAHALFLKRKQAPLLNVVQGGVFGVVLLLGRRTKEWRRKEGGEGWDVEAVRSEIKAMHDTLRTQGSMLVKVLRALDDRGQGKTGQRASSLAQNKSVAVPKELDIPLERGASGIQELLVRLDANRFYSSRAG